MAIGLTPLIPLNRVLPIPDARLQRFGMNDSLLFGKPMVEVTAPKARPIQVQQAVTHPAPAQAQPQDALESRSGLGANPSATTLGLAPSYSGRVENQMGGGTAAKVGSLLNTKA